MNTLIFEGIATSGKSTLIQHLRSALDGKLKIRIAGEEETHIPIMNATAEHHVNFYIDLIDKLTRGHPDLLIIDRFYLTQAFRAKTGLKQYKEVEHSLKPCNPVTIFLEVQPSAIANRIHHATLHRNPSWGDYIATKGKDRDKQAGYYIAQQNSQIKLLKESTLPHKIFDTTEHHYEDITEEILEIIGHPATKQGSNPPTL